MTFMSALVSLAYVLVMFVTEGEQRKLIAGYVCALCCCVCVCVCVVAGLIDESLGLTYGGVRILLQPPPMCNTK